MKKLFDLDQNNDGRRKIIQAISEISNIPVEKINNDTPVLDLAQKAGLSIGNLLEQVVLRTGRKIGNPESSPAFLYIGNITI